MSWFSFFFKVQCNTSCLPILSLSFSKIQNNLKKLLEDGEWNINVLGLLQTSFFCLDKPFQRTSAGQSSSFFIFSPSQFLTTVKFMSSCKKVSWFFSMYLYILKTYMVWSTCIYIFKMWGFFFLYCVWINGFYSLLDFRVAYTSANLVHVLLPQHLLYAYCHTYTNVKNVSHDWCTEVLCEWAGICFSYDYGLVLCSSFLLTSLHPNIPKIRK